jgi:hypothetical protein
MIHYIFIQGIVALMSMERMQLLPEYVIEVREELQKRYKTQEKLSTAIMEGEKDVSIRPTTISSFCSGNPVRTDNFKVICKYLGFDDHKKVGIEVLGGLSVNLKSDIIHRSGEDNWDERLLKPHALIKIHAPFEFGKTSLIHRMLDRAEKKKHITICLDLDDIQAESFQDASKFFRELFHLIIIELDKKQDFDEPISLDLYDRLVSPLNPKNKIKEMPASKEYLQYLIIKMSNRPFTLAINKIDRLIDFYKTVNQHDTANQFLSLWRSVHEASKRSSSILKEFRLILAYSTPQIEEYIPIIHNKSPFNVGHKIELEEFTLSEVSKLAKQKGLTLEEGQIAELMKSIGGIPHLIQLILDYFKETGVSFGQNLAAIMPIRDYLEVKKEWLKSIELDKRMQEICSSDGIQKIDLSKEDWRSLYRQGLVINVNGTVRARCGLYHDYFAQI